MARAAPQLSPTHKIPKQLGTSPPTCAPRRCRTWGGGKRTRAVAGETGSLPAGSTPARPGQEAACNVHTLASALLPPAGRPEGKGSAQNSGSAPGPRPLSHPVAFTSTRRPRPRCSTHRKAAQLVSSPGARPRRAAMHCSVSKPEQYRLPKSRHDDDEAPTWK